MTFQIIDEASLATSTWQRVTCMKQQRPFEKAFCPAGFLHEAGLVHAQYHRFLPTGRHWNFALQNFIKFLVQPENLCEFVSPEDKTRIPSNWDQHFGITCLVIQQRALSVFKKGPHWDADNLTMLPFSWFAAISVARIVARNFSIGGLCVCAGGAWQSKINQNSTYF